MQNYDEHVHICLQLIRVLILRHTYYIHSDMESFDCVTTTTNISPPVPNRKHLPRDSPKVCTVCNANTSSAWRVSRTNGEHKRICNKCAMKAKYNKTSQTYHNADLVRQEIAKLLIKYGTMKVTQIIELLEGDGGLEGISRLKHKISYNIRKYFNRVSPGVYRI